MEREVIVAEEVEYGSWRWRRGRKRGCPESR